MKSVGQVGDKVEYILIVRKVVPETLNLKLNPEFEYLMLWQTLSFIFFIESLSLN